MRDIPHLTPQPRQTAQASTTQNSCAPPPNLQRLCQRMSVPYLVQFKERKKLVHLLVEGRCSDLTLERKAGKVTQRAPDGLDANMAKGRQLNPDTNHGTLPISCPHAGDNLPRRFPARSSLLPPPTCSMMWYALYYSFENRPEGSGDGCPSLLRRRLNQAFKMT